MSTVDPASAPNPLQLEAITAPLDRAQKIVAGAGTGKTQTMVLRFAHLVELYGLDPNRILAVTFTNKAAGELRERVTAELLARGLVSDRAVMDSAWIGTFHALCTRLLREDSYSIGFDRDTTVIEQLEERLLVKEVQRALRDGEVPGAGILELETIGVEGAMKLSNDAFGFIRRMKGLGLGPDELRGRCSEASAAFWRDVVIPDEDQLLADERVAEEEAANLICSTYREYERRLTERRLLDFDGILIRTRDALREHPDWAATCRQRFQYLIVDEFQDTNRVQLEVLELLAQPGFANASVVGDPKQSIFGWRDAEISNILEFEGAARRLTANYRSAQPILDAATHIIHIDPQFAEEPRLMATGRSDGAGSVLLFRADNPETEAEFVARKILELHSAGRAWSDMAILTRMRMPPIAFEQELRTARIPYVTAGGHGFFEREEIKDLMAYLGVIDDPLDDQALVRLLQGPLVRVTDGELYRLFRRKSRSAGVEHAWDALALSESEGLPELDPSTAGRVREALALVRQRMESKGGISTAELVQDLLNATGYAAYAGADPSEADRRLGNLRKLYRMATEFEARQVFSGLREFIEYVDLYDEHAIDVGEAEDTGADAVRFMTIHTAKGLEFPVVFLAHLKPFREQHRGWLFFDEEMGLILRNLGDNNETHKHQSWKQARAGGLPMDLERAEMRRLIYVAITRAKDQVIISSTRTDEADWDAVLSDVDSYGKPRLRPVDDYFRSLAVWASQTGEGVLVDPNAVSNLPKVAAERMAAAAAGARAMLTPLAEAVTDRAPTASRLVVSFSELESFRQCPLRYRYIYEWRLPAPPDALWPQQSAEDRLAAVPASMLGTLVHATLEAFHRPGPDDGLGGIMRLRRLWDDNSLGLVSPNLGQKSWERDAKAMFERYLTLDIARYQTLTTEQEVNLVEVIQGQEILIRGFIDRLCRAPDGRTVLVDYKTNTAIREVAAASYSRQLAIYERAARVVLELEPEVILIELRRGVVHRLDQGASWNLVEELLREVVGGDRLAPSDPPCSACAYRFACPASRAGAPAQY
jgi:DNA helicase-2/ATP-dependent DNA helicase PcrA